MSPRNIERPKRQSASLLDEVLERRMLLYVLAAGATLAGASVAQAKVVFTRSDFVLTLGNRHLSIDLNNDGTSDFILIDHCVSQTSCFGSVNMYARAIGQNGVAQEFMGHHQQAAALSMGDQIGPAATFKQVGLMLDGSIFSGTHSFGPFAHTLSRFLGVRFLVSGQVHYGWIGFRKVNKFTGTLLGWAYETEPNKPILAGDTGESKESSQTLSAEPTSLQLLAMGHTGIADRQRRIAGNI
jgi:hypothetical protein